MNEICVAMMKESSWLKGTNVAASSSDSGYRMWIDMNIRQKRKEIEQQIVSNSQLLDEIN